MQPRVPASWRRWQDGSWKEESGSLAVEVAVRVTLNGLDAGELRASPHDLAHLAVGHLLLEGYVFDAARCRTSVANLSGHAVVSVDAPGARREEWKHPPRVPAGAIPEPDEALALVADMQKRAVLYAEGGGVHTSALFRQHELRFLAEDIGKVNTLGRLAGEAALAGSETRGMGLACTGRVTRAMGWKAALMGCPAVISVSGPTSAGLEVAREAGMTVIGYARGKGFNVYV